MTEKQYTVINQAEPRNQSVAYKGIPCTARTCVTDLNRLWKENNELLSMLKETYDELKYFVGLFKEDEVDTSVHNLLISLEIVTQNAEDYSVLRCFNYLVKKEKELSEENKQLKTQIKIFEKFLECNDLDIEWEEFCTKQGECLNQDIGCKNCIYLGTKW